MIRLRACGATARQVRGAMIVVAVALGMSLLSAQEKTSVKAGVYTAAQAERGQTLFRSKCASCHAPNRFTDDFFYISFAGKPLWEMFDVISDSMPEDNPGSMKKEEYADVIAYLLKLNNFPAGAAELPIDKDALSAILMEKPVSR
jgi:mono/diheme cytochrome c family protein